MSQFNVLLHHIIQQPSEKVVRLFNTSGRIDARGGRITSAKLLPNAIISVASPYGMVQVDLKAIPTQAPWTQSKRSSYPQYEYNEEADGLLLGCPYPNVDNETVLFIPSEAVVCKLSMMPMRQEDEVLDCEGYYDCEQHKLRLDAVDQDLYH